MCHLTYLWDLDSELKKKEFTFVLNNLDFILKCDIQTIFQLYNLFEDCEIEQPIKTILDGTRNIFDHSDEKVNSCKLKKKIVSYLKNNPDEIPLEIINYSQLFERLHFIQKIRIITKTKNFNRLNDITETNLPLFQNSVLSNFENFQSIYSDYRLSLLTQTKYELKKIFDPKCHDQIVIKQFFPLQGVVMEYIGESSNCNDTHIHIRLLAEIKLDDILFISGTKYKIVQILYDNKTVLKGHINIYYKICLDSKIENCSQVYKINKL
jgi:hypothetical protein